MVYMDRLPPHEPEAEEAVLGSVLIDAARMADVVGVVKPEAFYREAHRWIFEAMLALYKAGDPIDQLSVTKMLRTEGRLDDAGGPSYLSHLFTTTPTPVHANYYARQVAEAWTLRLLIEAGGEIVARAYEGGDPLRAIEAAHDLLFSIDQTGSCRGGLHAVRETLDEYLEEQSSFDPLEA